MFIETKKGIQMKTIFRGSNLEMVECIVFDIDNTLYKRTKEHFNYGTERELRGVARCLNIDYETVLKEVDLRRKELSFKWGRKVALTEVVYDLGVTPGQWSELRVEAWNPDMWVNYNEKLHSLIESLSKRYKCAFGTNSPIKIGKAVLSRLKINGLGRIFGPENLGVSKPSPDFFTKIAGNLGVATCNCISVGDREFSDAVPAIEAKYFGAIVVEKSPEDLFQFNSLMKETAYV